MNRFVLIMPYYGRLPLYFPQFLKSLKGKLFDVLFVSDLQVDLKPDNFKVLTMSLAALRDLASKKLDVPVKLEDPKKLCDFKPMYGKIFEDYISAYDYWMLGDCDLVFGQKFNAYLNEIFIGVWDVVSMRKPWFSGPCAILRNSEIIKNLFHRTKNWQEVATEGGANNLWDECGGCWHYRLESGEWSMSDCEIRRDSFGAAVFRSSDIRFRHEDDITECGLKGHVVTMSANGILKLDQEEISCFHYIGIKTRRFFTCPKITYDRIGSYCIDEAGFYFSTIERTFRSVIRWRRKFRALCISLIANGFGHWVRRITK